MIRHEFRLCAASLVFFFCTSAQGQPVQCTDAAFDHSETPSPINGLWNLDVGDLDGDGDLDVVTVGIYDGGAFAIYKNRGDGTFDEPAVHVIGEDPRCILLRDLDGDSDLDLIVSNSLGHKLFVYLNAGNGVFEPPDSEYEFPARAEYFAVGDLDGDGDLDLAVSDGNSIQLLWNRGDGYFDFGPSYSLGYNGSEIVAADLDGDCDLDLAGLVRTNYLSQDGVCVRYNDGSGGFDEERCYYPVPSWSTLALAAADVDGDGDLDLAGTNEPNARPAPVGMWVIFNDGIGRFGPATVYPVGYWPADVQFADLDGDGDLDAVVANENAFQFYPPPHDVSILLNRGDGTFEQEKRYPVGEEPIAVMACDLDGDLDLDIAVANFGWYGPSTISTLINLHDPRADADCDDGIPCTIDRCALGQGCRNYPDDTFCSDGLFCNGMERCVAGVGCEPAAGPPCLPDAECDEAIDGCLGHPPCEPEWAKGFVVPGVYGSVYAMAVFKNALYVGGFFSKAGDVPASNIAKWDGTSWSAVGSGTNGYILDLTVFDEGSGPALYVGGSFTTAGGLPANYVAKWDGSSWSALGLGVGGELYTSVQGLGVFNDGSGPALYAGGQFRTAGGAAANYIAKWDGASWTPLGLGMNGPVYALTVFNDGDGFALYAAGYFTAVEGVPTDSIAKWNGSTWSAMGERPDADNVIIALAVFDDGNGPAIYAGGQYDWTDGRDCENGPIFRKWKNGAWSPTGTSVGQPHYGFYDYGACVYDPADSVWALTIIDDGSGQALYVGGKFSIAGGVPVNSVAKWNGSSWSPLGSTASHHDSNTYVFSLTAFEDGTHPAALYAGGHFTAVGGIGSNNIAAWTGTSWSVLGTGTGIDDSIRALTVFDDGGGPALYAGGYFLSAGGGAANHIAKWDGSGWSPLGSGMNDLVTSLTDFDDGGGPALYAGGSFTTAGGSTANQIAKWNPGAPGSWSAVGTHLNAWGSVLALTVFDDGTSPALYAGGYLNTGNASQVIRWDGSSWSALPEGSGVVNVFALASFDDGSGPALYIGGNGSWGLAKWNGSSWSKPGTGVNSTVTALTVYDDGGGPALYVGGWFSKAGGVSANYIAKWDGKNWSPLGNGLNGAPYVLRVLDDGGGPALYAGGYFTAAGGVEANHIAMWNGIIWSAVGTGTNDAVLALAAFNDANGPALYAGGPFTTAGDNFSAHLAKWSCVRRGDMNQDSVVDLSDCVMFSDCLGGPSHTVDVAPCASGDIDSDGDMDLLDFAEFQRAFGQ